MTLRAATVWLVLCGAAARAHAGGGAAADSYDDISAGAPVDAHALLDVYALHNFNQPASATNQLRAFDTISDRPSLGYLRLTLARRPRRVGFRLDVGTGDTSDDFFRSDPAAPAHPDLARAQSHVEQAFVTVVVPLGSGVIVDAGKFDTPVGLEDNISVANWNYSRSLLFSWAEPSLNSGIRVTYRATEKLALSLFWLNGWNSTFTDGSDLRSFAGAATWHPTSSVAVVAVYLGWLERPATDLAERRLSFRNLFDGYVTYAPERHVAFALTVDYGNDRADGGVYWWGASGYARFQVLSWLGAALRGEFLADPQGFVTGTPQTLAELTATAEARVERGRARLFGRVEYRHDQSNARVFEGALPNVHTRQDTLTLALMTTL
jgi:hypothetical protein